MSKTIRENNILTKEFDNAVAEFDKKCHEVIQRCIEEEKHAEAVENNAGKELNFFQAPTLFTRERFGIKQRLQRANSQK